MTRCICVRCSERGIYEIPVAATEENWDDVTANCDQVTRWGQLMGWGDWTAAYLVTCDGADLFYFVAE